jgi:hypothetical protein
MSNPITTPPTAGTRHIDLSRIRAGWFYINAVAGPTLLISLFLPWFSTTGAGVINRHAGSISAWHTFGALNAYLIWIGIGCVTVAPWIAVRGDRLSWTPGEMSIVFAIVGVFVILLNGFIMRPGSPSAEIHLAYGYPIALAAATAITYSSVLRTGGHYRRQPPGGLV